MATRARKARGARVPQKRVYIRKGQSPWNVYIRVPPTVDTIMGIDIGPRNLGLKDVRVRPYKQLRRFLWVDVFRDPAKNYSKISDLRSAVITFVREHPDWFSADLWLIEEQPALQPENVAMQQALETAAQFLGKQVLLVAPLTLKTVLLPGAFPQTGHDTNKMQSMALRRPFMNEHERLAVKAAVLRQEAYARRYRKGREPEGVQYRRYKSGKVGCEAHCWDDMADADVFTTLAMSVIDDADYFNAAIPYDFPPEPGFFNDDVWLDEQGQFHVRWPDGSSEELEDTLRDYFDTPKPPGVLYEDETGPVETAARRVKPGRLNPRGIEPRKRKQPVSAVPTAPKKKRRPASKIILIED